MLNLIDKNENINILVSVSNIFVPILKSLIIYGIHIVIYIPILKSLKLSSSFLFLIKEKYFDASSFSGGKHIRPITSKLILLHSSTKFCNSSNLIPDF